MLKRSLLGVICLCVLMVASVTLAQGVITDIKTLPLRGSETTIIPLAIHNTDVNPGLPGAIPGQFGWAGGIVDIHLLDNAEIDLDGVQGTAGGVPGVFIPEPLGPRSSNVESAIVPITVWHPLAQASGIDLTASVNQPILDLVIHAKGSGSTPEGVNSDIDMTLGFWNIWHLRGGSNSQIIQVPRSALWWVSSNIQQPADFQQFHFPGTSTGTATLASLYFFPAGPPTPQDPTAHWIHLTETLTFHLFGNEQSAFIATFLNVATLGLEHVPEPATWLLVVLGGAFFGIGLRARRKRLSH